jgi:methionyl aminopeptidase
VGKSVASHKKENNKMLQKIGRNDPCWCGSGKKYKVCHEAFDNKIKRFQMQGHIVPTHDIIKTPEQVEKIKESCKINIAVLDYIEKNIHEGMKLAEIDRIVYDMTTDMGGIPAPLNYEGYPYSVCTSLNSQVCHGFPTEDVELKNGDILNVDCSTILNGYFSDSSRMFCIGEISGERKKLVQVAKECVKLGLKEVKPWGFMGDMGQAVHDHAFANGYSVVREIGGHGVGLEFHEEPWVSYNTLRGQEMLLVPGMIFTIEPMINMGKPDIWIDEKNDWEVYTEDGLDSAQWEIMVLVTEDGNEVLCW